ncbi:glycosyltransferase family 2 protein [Pseudomonas sp. EA_15y_Pfl1_P101]|uniref:glycosyltransferase family 2 protein n=1 Tax=Pseudomonas sp. EA_15y_Pfl1_P101 TaxID=3088684 RepID=UPI0030DD9BC5
MITILTATYNRYSTLPRLLKSLLEQSSKEFEWVLIDDGSSDGTQNFIDELKKKDLGFTLTAVRQSNAGKHAAINSGVAAAKTNWIFIVDSDDALVPDAVETINTSIATATDKTVGLCYRKAYFSGELLGNDLSTVEQSFVSTPTEAGKLFKGDLAYIFRTDVISAFPFPIFKNEKFVPELYIWNKLGDAGDIIFFTRRIIYLCDYLEDGYSRNFSRHLRANPKGFFTYYWSQFLREKTVYYKLKNLIRSVQCLLYMLLGRPR